ncbi:MAG: hypothetical protein PHS54_03880 [Clostridia bacterium]|nr:hypothetical protein [Clostridia bacterium]
MEQKYIDYIEEFIGKEWILEEFDKIEKRSQLKEIGARYFNYHPFVKMFYELRYLLRKAEHLGEESIVLGKIYERLSHSGFVLEKQMEKIPNKIEFKSRLRDSENFEDVIWELETATMLMYKNIVYNFNNTETEKTSDISCEIENIKIDIECKNKHADKRIDNKNNIFFHLFCNAIGKVAELRGKVIDIKFDESRTEDIPILVDAIKSKCLEKEIAILTYKIDLYETPNDFEPFYAMSENDVSLMGVVSEQKKSELYKNIEVDYKKSLIIIFRFPFEKTNLNGIKSLVRKANKQVKKSGVVFLKVPYDIHDESARFIERFLNGSYSKIAGIKLVSFKNEYINDFGVKISRKERYIINHSCTSPLSEACSNFFSSDFAFLAYKNYDEIYKRERGMFE